MRGESLNKKNINFAKIRVQLKKCNGFAKR